MKKILIVQDDLSIMSAWAQYFQKIGWEVFQATDGLKAIEIFARNQDIGIVVTEIRLPLNIDGFEVSRNIRRMSPETKICVIAGSFWPEEQELVVRSGANACMQKPFKAEEILKLFPSN